jgi:hypothetical protein
LCNIRWFAFVTNKVNIFENYFEIYLSPCLKIQNSFQNKEENGLKIKALTSNQAAAPLGLSLSLACYFFWPISPTPFLSSLKAKPCHRSSPAKPSTPWPALLPLFFWPNTASARTPSQLLSSLSPSFSTETA